MRHFLFSKCSKSLKFFQNTLDFIAHVENVDVASTFKTKLFSNVETMSNCRLGKDVPELNVISNINISRSKMLFKLYVIKS